MDSVPHASTGTDAAKEKIRRMIERRQLVGAANDTKWDILIDAMRSRSDWRPSYRYQCVDAVAGYISDWDVEWWYHLPFPMLSVEWLDIAMAQEISRGQLLPVERIDHRGWILALLDDAGLCYETCGDIVRIFGYLPKSYEGIVD